LSFQNKFKTGKKDEKEKNKENDKDKEKQKDKDKEIEKVNGFNLDALVKSDMNFLDIVTE